MHKLFALTALAATTALCSAQQASVTNYGRGCTLPGSPPPLIRNTGLPKLGATFIVRYIGPNSRTPVSIDQPMLLAGLAQANTPIPPITPLQPRNCSLLLVPFLTALMPMSGSRFQDRFTVQIPNNRALLGATYYHQWAGVYSSCRPTCQVQMFRMSDAARIVIGL